MGVRQGVSSRIVSMCIAASVAAALCVVPQAFAQSSITAGETSGAPASTRVAPQASKVSMWVVSKAVVPVNGAAKATYTYTYDSKGLLTKGTEKYQGNVVYNAAYTYSNNRLGKAVVKRYSTVQATTETTKMTYSNDGKLKKRVCTSKWTADNQSGSYQTTDTFTYNAKNQLTKHVEKLEPAGSKVTYTFSKFNKAGMPMKKVAKATWGSDTFTYSYDSHGYPSSLKGKYDSKGRLAKIKVNGGSDTVTFAYKKVSVPKNLVNTVKQQQYSLCNLGLAPAVFVLPM